MRNQGSKKGGKVPPAVFPRPGQRLAQEEDGCAASSIYDAVVCGGTLGLFVALALQLRGHKVHSMQYIMPVQQLLRWCAAAVMLSGDPEQ